MFHVDQNMSTSPVKESMTASVPVATSGLTFIVERLPSTAFSNSSNAPMSTVKPDERRENKARVSSMEDDYSSLSLDSQLVIVVIFKILLGTQLYFKYSRIMTLAWKLMESLMNSRPHLSWIARVHIHLTKENLTWDGMTHNFSSRTEPWLPSKWQSFLKKLATEYSLQICSILMITFCIITMFWHNIKSFFLIIKELEDMILEHMAVVLTATGSVAKMRAKLEFAEEKLEQYRRKTAELINEVSVSSTRTT